MDENVDLFYDFSEYGEFRFGQVIASVDPPEVLSCVPAGDALNLVVQSFANARVVVQHSGGTLFSEYTIRLSVVTNLGFRKSMVVHEAITC